LLHFWKFEITLVLYPKRLAGIDYHEVIPHWKGIHTVKINLRWLAVATLLATISVPASLMAINDAPTGPAPKGPITVPTPPNCPIDGNPTGPPKVVAGQ
jgi:hypothetical protein